VTPERILDTRDPNNIGLSGPFVSAVSQKLQVTGSIPTATGTKTVVPTGATGVLLNVTPVNPTAAGFISIRPGDATGAATTSSLNFTTGVAGIVPNAVQVAVPTAGTNEGEIDITYDAYGQAGPTTDILIDVVGYMTSAGLQDLTARVTALEAATATLDASQPFALASRSDLVNVGGPTVVVAVSIVAPVDGQVTVMSSASAAESTAADDVACSITTGNTVDTDYEQRFESTGSPGQWESMAGTRLFDLNAGATGTYNLVCANQSGSTSNIFDSALSAIFTPAK
jgi:hypothetical protein